MKSDVPTSRHRHLHPTMFRPFGEESMTLDDAKFMLRSKGRSSATDTFNFFQNKARKEYNL